MKKGTSYSDEPVRVCGSEIIVADVFEETAGPPVDVVGVGLTFGSGYASGDAVVVREPRALQAGLDAFLELALARRV